jgi:hypothetical protein
MSYTRLRLVVGKLRARDFHPAATYMGKRGDLEQWGYAKATMPY